MTVQRYAYGNKCGGEYMCGVIPNDDGAFVFYEDYEQLEAENKTSLLAIAALRAELDELDGYHNEIEQLKLSLKIRYKEGFIASLKEFAWWKDGVQYVGTCGTTLKKAIEKVLG